MGWFSKQQPFNQLKNREEIEEYFKNAKHWKHLKPNIVKAIIDTLINDLKMFNQFVILSFEEGLVASKYNNISNSTPPEAALLAIAHQLYSTGSLYRDHMMKNADSGNNKEAVHLLKYAITYFELSMKLHQNLTTSSSYQLAFLWGNIAGNKDKGVEYCKMGLEAILPEFEELREPLNSLQTDLLSSE